MRCIVCGTNMNSTTGGNYHCPTCGHTINDLVFRPSNCDMPMPQGFGEQGWICPVCGRGLAPWISCCPCINKKIEITYETMYNEDGSYKDTYTLLSEIAEIWNKESDIDAESVDCKN